MTSSLGTQQDMTGILFFEINNKPQLNNLIRKQVMGDLASQFASGSLVIGSKFNNCPKSVGESIIYPGSYPGLGCPP